ncbi:MULTISPECIES: bifunctional 3,4-dihydroxy-2-butanone-4-phosphate synthase/GTP cyclohydrolase II [Acetobacter]|uniref:bifunctional 3,4-dihydroxy-2-butanone-4-phosphate synthase/GTP cyclohydrolase II n=1 Tax=Acetobacter TaxID=434 RepID=UPI00054F7926|nr:MULTISPECIES: bifunctional 3,4-dihydroxy-2-butanone-4-phosphate synthase/GTP cyclohydrolase II [Acetobacter]ATI13448.1 bifunctional 3,4-dihydroxy-2-butanone-4-phosphate synthase/GTP cyclohydrolase II [Acetobacter pomorum]AXC27750.1 bifunctional 3,4-dihydroxy-2-butanone-4-phosphate synthase/GTP cyclohydrolase II [Acetobacter sp. JWB]KAA8422421.1 bifunctional 3,4-dihydroxy-2-butanone-4-phosphate synthase/GTP cyclohydrolase II [Acetobacter pomorum]KAA8438814.1 bifunctional 3,4-dihydroxy-2-butan
MAAKASARLLQAVEAVRAGRMVIMVDDEDRENEGDLVMAAEFMTPEAMNFMITHARGLVCLPLTPKQVDRLGLAMMVRQSDNTAQYGTAFTVSIEAKEGVSTGISAPDRAHTVRVAASENATPADIATPGHIFPLRAAPGGVLERIGHTEGSIDLLRLAGLKPAAVICEILNEDGTMARRPQLEVFARQHDLPIVSIAELVTWIKAHGLSSLAAQAAEANPETAPEPAVPDLAQASLPSAYGGDDLIIHAFQDENGVEHVALVKGDVRRSGAVPLVRLHSECVTGDALGSLRCDCGSQLHAALRAIGQAECGVLVYVRGHEGRGIGLVNKIRAYELQDAGLDTVDANHRLGFATDARDWRAASGVLRSLGVGELDLLTNNPDKVRALEARGFMVRRRIGLEIPPTAHNRAYLEAKRRRMGHHLGQFIAVDAEPDAVV